MAQSEMIFGYARVSTDKQNLDRQIDALEKYGAERIYEEKVSGARNDLSNRPALKQVLVELRPGDVLVVYELKRLGRSTKQLLELAEEFNDRGIEFVSITENIDTSTPMGKFVFTTWCALAQLDRDIIAENTKSGLAAARLRGRIPGRKPMDKEIINRALKMYYTREFSVNEICDSTGMSRATLYKHVRKQEAEREMENDAIE